MKTNKKIDKALKLCSEYLKGFDDNNNDDIRWEIIDLLEEIEDILDDKEDEEFEKKYGSLALKNRIIEIVRPRLANRVDLGKNQVVIRDIFLFEIHDCRNTIPPYETISLMGSKNSLNASLSIFFNILFRNLTSS